MNGGHGDSPSTGHSWAETSEWLVLPLAGIQAASSTPTRGCSNCGLWVIKALLVILESRRIFQKKIKSLG